MLDNYTITENSDNRIKYLCMPKQDEIIIGGSCTHVFILPFLYSDSVIESEIIYKQGLEVVLIKIGNLCDIKEDFDKQCTTLTVNLFPDDTLLFKDNLLDTSVQIKIYNIENEILYNIPNKLKIRRPLDIPTTDNLGIPQEKQE